VKSDSARDLEKVAWDSQKDALIDAVLAASPAQRLAWLEAALHLAFASGAITPRRGPTEHPSE
jgi:hypothetical protein